MKSPKEEAVGVFAARFVALMQLAHAGCDHQVSEAEDQMAMKSAPPNPKPSKKEVASGSSDSNDS